MRRKIPTKRKIILPRFTDNTQVSNHLKYGQYALCGIKKANCLLKTVRLFLFIIEFFYAPISTLPYTREYKGLLLFGKGSSYG